MDVVHLASVFKLDFVEFTKKSPRSRAESAARTKIATSRNIYTSWYVAPYMALTGILPLDGRGHDATDLRTLARPWSTCSVQLAIPNTNNLFLRRADESIARAFVGGGRVGTDRDTSARKRVCGP